MTDGIKPDPLSTLAARQLIDECMVAYLRSLRLDENAENAEDEDSMDPLNPSREERDAQVKVRMDQLRPAFEPLETYLRSTYGKFACLNSAFSNARPSASRRTRSEGAVAGPVASQPFVNRPRYNSAWNLSEVNGKTLLVGDVAENAALWMGANEVPQTSTPKAKPTQAANANEPYVSRRSPYIDWPAVHRWYETVLQFDKGWMAAIYDRRGWAPGEASLLVNDTVAAAISDYVTKPAPRPKVFWDVTCAAIHAQRLLLKSTEKLLKRPGLLLDQPQHLRFLLIILRNPLLYSYRDQHPRSNSKLKHSQVVSATVGQLVNSNQNARRYLPQWISHYDDHHFRAHCELLTHLIRYRLQRVAQGLDGVDVDADRRAQRTLVDRHRPDPHAVLGQVQARSAAPPRPTQSRSGAAAAAGEQRQQPDYFNDWQLASTGALASVLFAANTTRPANVKLPFSFFYSLAFDSYGESALLEDFHAWESRKHKFTFCSFPFLLSMSAKISILQFDANRQQTDEARKAWFQQFTSNHLVSSNLNLRVRRDCLAADTLREIKAVASTDTSQNDLRKALRIYFADEDGIDAGGLRKEFFLLLMRELLDPLHGERILIALI